MDIQYLLFLQDFRNSIDNALTPFMEGVSMFAVTYLILFPVYYYWNRNKKDGMYALVAYYFCMVITPLVKLTACVYRPWIRDSRIVPAGKAIVTATGYSFPSGHTTTAVPLAGGMVVNTWKEPAAPRRLCFLLPRPRIYHAQAVPDGLYGRWQAPCRSAEDDERRIRRYRKDDGIYYRPPRSGRDWRRPPFWRRRCSDRGRTSSPSGRGRTRADTQSRVCWRPNPSGSLRRDPPCSRGSPWRSIRCCASP